jgi:K+-transporting ATPase KdpF subunit
MDYLIAAIVAIGLFIYLMHALLRPEKFWVADVAWDNTWIMHDLVSRALYQIAGEN